MYLFLYFTFATQQSIIALCPSDRKKSESQVFSGLLFLLFAISKVRNFIWQLWIIELSSSERKGKELITLPNKRTRRKKTYPIKLLTGADKGSLHFKKKHFGWFCKKCQNFKTSFLGLGMAELRTLKGYNHLLAMEKWPI